MLNKNLSEIEVIKSLVQWGYIEGAICDTSIRIGIMKFKETWGCQYNLSSDYSIDDSLVNLVSNRFCNCPDNAILSQQNINPSRWEAETLGWFGNVRIGNLNWQDAQQFTVNEVGRVSNMRLTPDSGIQNLFSVATRIDGPGNILGQAYLPRRPSTVRETLRQEFDIAEINLSQNAFRILVLHELCHSLGLSHNTGPRGAVMDPFLDPNLTELQTYDINELLKRYGEPKFIPAPPPTNPPTHPDPGPNPEPQPPLDRCPRRVKRALAAALREMEED